MSEISLNQLRQLRGRAQDLLSHIQIDLGPFAKEDGTFRRKPDSVSPLGDVNVTTTCSCLMALAATNNFQDFYKGKEDIGNHTDEVFGKIFNAPWMSSGLNGNNAFTTTLVLRTFGFLKEQGLFGSDICNSEILPERYAKKWDLYSGIKNPIDFALRLREPKDFASQFIWNSFLDATRNKLRSISLTFKSDDDRKSVETKIKTTIALDLQRIIQSGWIYHESVFDNASASTIKTLKSLQKNPMGYSLADANYLLLADQFPKQIEKPKNRSLKEIACLISADAINFSINEYSPSAAVIYWFVDGIARAQITLPKDNWTAICQWASKEFSHERSLVVANHDAMMDPIAMGMSACLCSRLRAISDKESLGTTKEHLSSLPSLVELECAIEELILKQTKSGIWNKYFPLFHYQDAGSNFCFTFELLEAVLYEFGNDDNKILENSQFIEGLEKAVKWCENSQQKCSEKKVEYCGWNSGGNIETLEKGQPESWATAVVHMFLYELVDVVSKRIQKKVLQKYKATTPKSNYDKETAKDGRKPLLAIDKLLDIELLLREKPIGLSEVLRTRIIDKCKTSKQSQLRRNPIKGPLSALLFGPPGTSKTEVTKAIAEDLGWPLVEINPSDFVRGTLANVYFQADEIFDDLLDLAGVVVFFDEMDALVQTREGEITLDIASQFLTTTMLPKLTKLHDKARVVFLMATNYQDRFDAAIKRAGRFDLLLCMGPPTLDEKLRRLHIAFKLEVATKETIEAGELIQKYLEDQPKLQDQLALFTYGEYKAFLKTIGDVKTINSEVKKIKKKEFIRRLKAYSKYVSLRTSDLAPLEKIGLKWKRIGDLDKLPFNLRQIERKKLQITHIVRYFSDRKESKEQH